MLKQAMVKLIQQQMIRRFTHKLMDLTEKQNLSTKKMVRIQPMLKLKELPRKVKIHRLQQMQLQDWIKVLFGRQSINKMLKIIR
jgi:hypothetical protein